MVTRPPVRDSSDAEAFRSSLKQAARKLGRSLTDEETGALVTHYRLLRHWNKKINLTGLTAEHAILDRHFLEPIAVADLLEGGGSHIDLGSGNGFPAIPLKILNPELNLVMVESSEKKSAFLWAVVREAGLTGAEVATRRIDSRSDLADLLPCRYLTLRAVRLAHFFENSEGPPILEPGGRALFFMTPGDADRLRSSPPSGLRWAGSRPLPSTGGVVAVLEPSDR